MSYHNHIKKTGKTVSDIIYEIMNYKVKAIYAAVIIVIAVVAAVIVFRGGSGLNLGSSQDGLQTPQGKVAAPGASPVSASGQVIAPSGQIAKLDVQPGSSQAPQESNPISIKDVPASAIKLTITSSGWSSSSFTVKSGATVTISVTSGDRQTHLFAMDSPSLSALAVGVGPDETRLITFNAPRAGTYGFHCGVPGHAARGEVGKMIVE